jgi:hypothetical protein
MTKQILKLLVLILFVFTSCSKDDAFEDITINPAQKDPLTAQQINAQIDESMSSTGSFNWKNASNQLLWSATYRGNNIITIGFGTSATDFDRSKSSTNQKMQLE